MPVVLLVGTLDTKGNELSFVRDLLHTHGLVTITIDAGTGGLPSYSPEIDRELVLRRAGTSTEEIRAQGDRGHAVARAAEGVAAVVTELAAREFRVSGVFALGGSAGTAIGTAAMRALPFGLPKVMVSTLASGQTRPYVGGSDLAMFPAVADLAGLNGLTRAVLTNAANALVGMIAATVSNGQPQARPARPIVAATMFGVTTPCVDRARRRLEESGFEAVVFHATGVGGQTMESLVRDGLIAGVLDMTTTELADELVGGILSAGPHRLEAAAERGIPQVLGVGALDMVNFGPPSSVPERFAGRLFHAHNPQVTLMRTTPEENAALGRRIAEVASTARGPTAIILPLGGVSALDAAGKPFFDPIADEALFHAIREGLYNAPQVRLVERPEHINDPAFADAAAELLIAMMPPIVVQTSRPDERTR